MLTENNGQEVKIGNRACVIFYTVRVAKDMTQSEFARKLGTTQAEVSRIENYCKRPTMDMLQKMSHLYDLTLDQLTGVKPIMRCEL